MFVSFHHRKTIQASTIYLKDLILEVQPLRPQEIRNCVFSGKLVDELNQINALPAWREIIGRGEPEKHQRDVEMILRIFAFWEHRKIYDKPMKGFLNQQMLQHKNGGLFKI